MVLPPANWKPISTIRSDHLEIHQPDIGSDAENAAIGTRSISAEDSGYRRSMTEVITIRCESCTIGGEIHGLPDAVTVPDQVRVSETGVEDRDPNVFTGGILAFDLNLIGSYGDNEMIIGNRAVIDGFLGPVGAIHVANWFAHRPNHRIQRHVLDPIGVQENFDLAGG